MTGLTERECEVVRGIHAGLPNKRIAYKTGQKEPTVRFHTRQILRKLNLENRTQIAVWAARVLGCLLFTITLHAQSQIQLVLDPANPSPLTPGAVLLDVVAVGFPVAAPFPSALQFSVTLPPNSTVTAVLAGALIGTTKQLQCVTIAPSLNCIVYGPSDATPLPAALALFAKLTITVPAFGNLSILVTKTSMSDPTGGNIAIAAATPLAVSIPNPLLSCDLNGDGVVNILDVASAVNQALGKDQGGNPVPCTNGDLTKDGVCNVLDVQRVVDAVLPGGACKTGQ